MKMSCGGNEAVTADEELKSFPDRQVAVGLVANGNKDFELMRL
jgi:hypothetical protein